MFTKVLVAEDMDHISGGVERMLKELGVQEIVFAQYCDDAMLLLRRAKMDGHPFPLLITDLSFKPSHRTEKLQDGEALLLAAKNLDPTLRGIVYSMEDRPQTVKQLLERTQAEGYVCKDRNGLQQLKEAVLAVFSGKSHYSKQVTASRNTSVTMLTDFDTVLLRLLAHGNNQAEISHALRQKGFDGSSRSAIEKRIRQLREDFGAKNTTHLVMLTRELRLI